MNRTLDLPEAVYTALRSAAKARGITPVAWIAAHLPERVTPLPAGGDPAAASGTLADRFAGRVGLIASGGGERLSEQAGERFGDHLEAKRRAGHL